MSAQRTFESFSDTAVNDSAKVFRRAVCFCLFLCLFVCLVLLSLFLACSNNKRLVSGFKTNLQY